ncbi:MAG TPA: methyltransferase domain-containing protein, partial [Candidatus Lokiarchaeia archaeon]
EPLDLIVMNDILEHLKEPPMVIGECYRLLKKGGELRIKVVYFSHRYAWGDPTHLHAFSEVYFEFFCKKTRRRDYYYDFAFEDIKTNFIYYDGDKIQAIEVILTK